MQADLISRETSALVIMDVQERLMPAIHGNAAMLERILFLADVARQLGVPVIVTEQYPKGLGPTVEAIRASVTDWNPISKLEFSCVPVPAFQARWRSLGRTQVVLTGVEAHVCVAQSALQLSQAGTRVFVVEDATGSRRPSDAATALERMRAGGVTITTGEAVAFEWLGRAGTDEFKAVAQRLKAVD